jgi:glycosyltransferase involved in cell wall biosynthesis
MSIEFSVLIPVYIKENPANLKTAMESVLDHQTVLPQEVVIVEDGPITKELEQVLSDISSKYPKVIRRIKMPVNQGMGAAMNLGLNNLAYKWVARMDSDDIAVPNRFETQTEFLKAHPEIDVLGSAIEEFDHTPGDLKHFRTLPEKHDEIIKLMKFRNPVNHMTVFFRRDVAMQAGGYWSNRFFEDYNLWYEMKKVGARFHNMNQNLVHVRVGNDMVGRRSGYAYFTFERILLKKFLADRFISPLEYTWLAGLKLLLRVMPTNFLRIVYKFFLRN